MRYRSDGLRGNGRVTAFPDLLIAFDVDFALAVEQNGYSIRDQGKPPDFVLEIASVSTGVEDYTGKRDDYAAFGIPEYWRFDPSGGRHHGAPLAGDRLIGDAYHPIGIVEIGQDHLHGHSDVLNLELCWDHGRLRWWGPAAQRYLLTFDEEHDTRIAEAEARASAEARAESAEVRVRELEAELERPPGSMTMPMQVSHWI